MRGGGAAPRAAPGRTGSTPGRPRRATAMRTCTYAASSRFHSRLTSSPPGCVPDIVTTAPETTSANVASGSATAAAPVQPGRGPQSAAQPRASSISTMASVSTTMASRKWLITAIGCRSVRTVMPPSGPWANVPTPIARASRHSWSSRPRRTRQAATASRSVDTITPNARMRLPYSMTVCDWNGRRGAAVAERPVGAAQAGVRDPHERARGDVDQQRHDRDHGQHEERALAGQPPQQSHAGSLPPGAVRAYTVRTSSSGLRPRRGPSVASRSARASRCSPRSASAGVAVEKLRRRCDVPTPGGT